MEHAAGTPTAGVTKVAGVASIGVAISAGFGSTGFASLRPVPLKQHDLHPSPPGVSSSDESGAGGVQQLGVAPVVPHDTATWSDEACRRTFAWQQQIETLTTRMVAMKRWIKMPANVLIRRSLPRGSWSGSSQTIGLAGRRLVGETSRGPIAGAMNRASDRIIGRWPECHVDQRASIASRISPRRAAESRGGGIWAR